jgi:hypothetical protein
LQQKMIKLSIHAQEAIALRGLRAEWIEATLISPAATGPDPRRPGISLSYKAIAEFGGRVLRVAHRPDGADVFVITAHFDRGAKI